MNVRIDDSYYTLFKAHGKRIDACKNVIKKRTQLTVILRKIAENDHYYQDQLIDAELELENAKKKLDNAKQKLKDIYKEYMLTIFTSYS